MAEVAILREYVLAYMQEWSKKWVNDDGTPKEVPYETAVNYCVAEISNIYAYSLLTIATAIDELVVVMNANTQQYDVNFRAIDTAITNIQTTIASNNEVINEALTNVYKTIGDNNTAFSKQLQNISAQMSNQNKVLDNQVIKLAKSISDRRK